MDERLNRSHPTRRRRRAARGGAVPEPRVYTVTQLLRGKIATRNSINGSEQVKYFAGGSVHSEELGEMDRESGHRSF